MAGIIHKELSYAVRGVMLDVHNQLGPLLPEVFYQQAVAAGLEEAGIRCETEKQFEVCYRNVQVGRYYVDVWIEEGSLLLEIKVAPAVLPLHRAQAISYLKVTGADLAVVANFGERRFADERLPNFLPKEVPTFQWERKKIAAETPCPALSNEVLEAMHRVHSQLGPGFVHYVYRRAMLVELRRQGVRRRYIKKLPVYYRGHYLGEQEARLIVVDERLLLAAVAVRGLDEALRAKLRARMRQLNLPVGLLANFSGLKLDAVVV